MTIRLSVLYGPIAWFEQGVVAPEVPAQLVKQGWMNYKAFFNHLKPSEAMVLPDLTPPPHGAAREVKTAVPLKRLNQLNRDILVTPAVFKVNTAESEDQKPPAWPEL